MFTSPKNMSILFVKYSEYLFVFAYVSEDSKKKLYFHSDSLWSLLSDITVLGEVENIYFFRDTNYILNSYPL